MKATEFTRRAAVGTCDYSGTKVLGVTVHGPENSVTLFFESYTEVKKFTDGLLKIAKKSLPFLENVETYATVTDVLEYLGCDSMEDSNEVQDCINEAVARMGVCGPTDSRKNRQVTFLAGMIYKKRKDGRVA